MSVWSRGQSPVDLQNSRELYTSTAVVGVSCELYLLARRTLDCRPLYLFHHNPVPPAPQLANFCNTRRCILNENNLFAEDFTSRDNKEQLLAACGKLRLLLSHIFEIFWKLLTFLKYFDIFLQLLTTFNSMWQTLAENSEQNHVSHSFTQRSHDEGRQLQKVFYNPFLLKISAWSSFINIKAPFLKVLWRGGRAAWILNEVLAPSLKLQSS